MAGCRSGQCACCRADRRGEFGARRGCHRCIPQPLAHRIHRRPQLGRTHRLTCHPADITDAPDSTPRRPSQPPPSALARPRPPGRTPAPNRTALLPRTNLHLAHDLLRPAVCMLCRRARIRTPRRDSHAARKVVDQYARAATTRARHANPRAAEQLAHGMRSRAAQQLARRHDNWCTTRQLGRGNGVGAVRHRPAKQRRAVSTRPAEPRRPGSTRPAEPNRPGPPQTRRAEQAGIVPDQHSHTRQNRPRPVEPLKARSPQASRATEGEIDPDQ